MRACGMAGILLIIIGILMTVSLFLAKVGPNVEVRDFSIHEIPDAQPPTRLPHDRIRFSDSGVPDSVAMGYRMRDWEYCMDGTWFYARNSFQPIDPFAETPCAQHGGIRAHGPGKKLNEP
jgi:hypothetical protein